MEPLTMIVTALTTGATAALGSVAGEAVKDAYAGLKRLILDRYGKQGDVSDAVETVEAETDADWPKARLQEALAETEAPQDEEVLAAAQALLTAADPQGARAGRYTSITGDGNVVGDDNTVIDQKGGDGAVQIGQARDVDVDD